ALGPGSGANGASGTDVPPIASFAGSFMRAADTGTPLTFSTSNNRTFLSVFDGASVTKTGPDSFLQLLGSGRDAVILNSSGSNIFVGATAARTPVSRLTLSGSMIEASNALLKSGDPAASANNAPTVLVFHDGAVVTKTDATPLVSLNGSDVITAGAL